MTFKPITVGILLAAATLMLGGCEQKAADGALVAQGSAPQGTISDELPDLQLLPNDAPLADPADLPPVPGASALPGDPAAPEPSPNAAPPAPAAPAPAEPALEGSIAE